MHECRYYYEKAFECMRRRNSPSAAFRYFCMYEYCRKHSAQYVVRNHNDIW